MICVCTKDTHILLFVLDLHQMLYPAKKLYTIIMHSNGYLIHIYAGFLFWHDTIAQCGGRYRGV